MPKLPAMEKIEEEIAVMCPVRIPSQAVNMENWTRLDDCLLVWGFVLRS